MSVSDFDQLASFKSQARGIKFYDVSASDLVDVSANLGKISQLLQLDQFVVVTKGNGSTSMVDCVVTSVDLAAYLCK